MFFTASAFLKILAALAVVLSVWLYKAFTYWSRLGLRLPSRPKFLVGHSGRLAFQKDSFAAFTNDVYRKLRQHLHGGVYFFWMPIYVPTDPLICKHIMQVDFQHFTDRGVYLNEQKDPLSAHLFSLEGAKWRNLRIKLTPTFTTGKMKMMFGSLVQCGDELTQQMDLILKAGKPVDIKDMLVRFTTDIIGTCAFGIDCNSLKNPNNEFCKHSKMFFQDTPTEQILSFLTFVMPKLMKKLGVRELKPKMAEFFMRTIKDTVDYREQNNVTRKDFMDLLLQLKNKGIIIDEDSALSGESQELDPSDNTFGFNQLAAQAFVFFLAGFETSSTTMTFCLFELASNPDVQEKLREEIELVLKQHDDKLTYESIMDMTYMDQVINVFVGAFNSTILNTAETLRKYPPLPALFRQCTKDYRVPNTDLVIEKGTKVIIPVIGLQKDETYFPEPEKFDPERFSDENKRNIVPYTYFPFGEGPRICIGLRFGVMQTKMGLCYLIKNYKFSVSSRTKVPLEMDPSSFIMTTKGGIWLDFTKA